MVYMGSKNKYAKYIVPILQKCIDDNNVKLYIEPFVGGANIIDKIKCENRYGFDRSDTLIALLSLAAEDFDKVMKDGNRELWDKGKAYVKDGIMPEDMTLAEIGAMEFFASYSNGGFPRGYAKNTATRNYYNEAYRNLEKQAPNLKNIQFKCASYDTISTEDLEGAVIYCFDKDTEILTSNGWKFLKDINIEEDTFLSREPDTKQLAYLKAIYKTSYHYKGNMIHYTGRQLDFCVTPDHKIFFNKKGKKTRKDHFLPAKDFIKNTESNLFIKAGGIWTGTNDIDFDLCGQKVDFIKFSHLLGIFITDGCINNQDNITISQSKINIQQKIEQLLTELNIEHTIHTNRNGKVYYLSRKYIPFFKQFYLKENRKIPAQFKNASVEAIRELIEGILDGDSDNERRKIYLSSKTLVDDIQECLFKIGKASNYSVKPPKKSYLESEDRWITGTKNNYVVSILNTEYPLFYKKNVSLEEYDDMVYCVTLEKWHTVLVRRNGKTIWLGQCDPPYQGTHFYGYANQPRMNYEHFWEWVRELSKNNYVFVSEQSAPHDFKAIWTQEVKRTTNKENNFKAVEHLYVYSPEET